MPPRKPKKGVVASGRSINPKPQTLATNRRKNARTPATAKPQVQHQPRWPTTQQIRKADPRFDYKPLPTSINPSILCLKIESGAYRRAFVQSQGEPDERKRWVCRTARADWEISRSWRDYIWRTRHEPLLSQGVNDWETLRQAAQEGKQEWELRVQGVSSSTQVNGSSLIVQSTGFASLAEISRVEQTSTARSLDLQQQQQTCGKSNTSILAALETETSSRPQSASSVRSVHSLTRQRRPLDLQCITPESSPVVPVFFKGVKAPDTSPFTQTTSDQPAVQFLQAGVSQTFDPSSRAQSRAAAHEHLQYPPPPGPTSTMSIPNPTTASTEESIKELIHSLHSIQQHIHPSTFHPTHQADLNATLIRTAQNIVSLREHVSPITNPSNPLHALTLAPEAIDYVDAGRNPDIYTREFVELVQRGNSVMNGKQQAFRKFSEIFATDLKKAFGRGVEEEVDLVMESAGMVDRSGQWVDTDVEREGTSAGHNGQSNGVRH